MYVDYPGVRPGSPRIVPSLGRRILNLRLKPLKYRGFVVSTGRHIEFNTVEETDFYENYDFINI
jgi:hypothetical protein